MDTSRLDVILYRENGTKRAIVNLILVGLNVVVWCVMELLGNTLDSSYIAVYGGLYPEAVMVDGEWYRLFTSMFIHFGLHHLINNMLILAVAGDKLEEAAGSLRYLAIYLGAGLTGGLLSLYHMVRDGECAVSAGASGGVFGVIGALVWVAVRNHGRFEGLTTRGLLLMIVLCLYNGITSTGIDNWAHVGGAVGGFLLCMLCYRKRTAARPFA